MNANHPYDSPGDGLAAGLVVPPVSPPPLVNPAAQPEASVVTGQQPVTSPPLPVASPRSAPESAMPPAADEVAQPPGLDPDQPAKTASRTWRRTKASATPDASVATSDAKKNEPPLSRLAVTSFVFAMLAFVPIFGIVAIAVSRRARDRIVETRERGYGLAMAAEWVGGIVALLSTAILLILGGMWLWGRAQGAF